MRARRALPAAALLLLALAGMGAAADEIRLRDGEILHGSVQGGSGVGSASQVRVAVRGGERVLARDDVLEIVTGVEPFERVADAYAPGAHRADPRAPRDAAQRWGAARRRALQAGGGTSASEALVERALTWLAAHQDEDGKVDADGFMKHDPPGARCDGAGGGHHGERVPCGYDGVTTALALMAWSAGGSTAVSGPYRENVARALAWARERLAAGPGGAYGMWNHGFLTQAVVDAYLLRPDPTWVEPIRAAVRATLALQRADGGWSYYMPIGDVPTTTVAGSALGLAARAGFAVPSDAVAALLAFLDARVDPQTGRSEYHDGAEQKGYTPTRANAAGALAVRALLGRLPQTARRAPQVAAIRDKPVWKLEVKEVKTQDGRTVKAQVGNLYPWLWYQATVALFEEGGGAWTAWYAALRGALAKGQRRDGSFAGSWDPLGTYSDSGGRAFVTGLCTLMLQAPYRYGRLR